MIVRGPHTETGWLVLSNQVVRDRRLSLRAIGLLAHLLSHEPGWKVNSIGLAKYWEVGRDQIRHALNELLEHGYAIRYKTQDEAGRWRTETIIFDCPQTLGDNTDSYPLPTPENPYVGESGAKRKTILKKNNGTFMPNETLIGLPHLCGNCHGFGTNLDTDTQTLTKCENCKGEGLTR